MTNGQQLPFMKVDHEWGVLSTEDAGQIAEIETAIRRQRGGISEITEAEFVDFVKKKDEALSQRKWREELAKGPARPLPTPPTSLAPVAGASDAPLPELPLGGSARPPVS